MFVECSHSLNSLKTSVGHVHDSKELNETCVTQMKLRRNRDVNCRQPNRSSSSVLVHGDHNVAAGAAVRRARRRSGAEVVRHRDGVDERFVVAFGDAARHATKLLERGFRRAGTCRTPPVPPAVAVPKCASTL